MIELDPASALALHEQIKAGLRALAAKGALRPGDPIPLAEALAVTLRVNPAAISRAFADLGREGFLVFSPDGSHRVSPRALSAAALAPSEPPQARPNSREVAFALDDVRRSFAGKPVLRGITAHADKGAAIGLLGRNGEGKSTLFKILLDMLAVDSGRVEVLGRTPDGLGALRRLIGYIPERPSFHEFMSVAEVFALRARFFPGWRMDKAYELARQLGLDPAARVRGASKGTLGKLAWACATAHEPELLLLDEPTSGLDAVVRDEILARLIGELHGQGATILVSNHRMEELAGLLDQVWVLSGGAISAVYDLDALRAQARRVTGRPREGAAPEGIPLIPMSGQGPLAQWAVFVPEALEMIRERRLLEDMDVSPLPVETALKLILRREEGLAHA